jgi:hypothetical protein
LHDEDLAPRGALPGPDDPDKRPAAAADAHAHATQQLAAIDLETRATHRLGDADLTAGPPGLRALRPVHVLLEPSYVPMAPGRPDAIEVFLPAGAMFVRPWRGAARELRLAEPVVVRLHSLALNALSVAAPHPARPTRDVVPMTLILRYEGFAHRWTVAGPGRPALDALVGALAELAGLSGGYESAS